MIRAGAGISMLRETGDAARAAVSHALRDLDDGPIDLAFLFATTPHAAKLPEAVGIVREHTRARHLVGGLASGIFSLDGSVEGGAGLALLLVQADGTLSCTPFLERELGDRSEASGESCGRTLRPQRGEASVIVALADVNTLQPVAFLDGLEREVGGVAVVGGATNDDGSLGRSCQVLGDAVIAGGACGVMLHGGVRSTIVVNHSCVPAGDSLLVTRARGNLLLELDGQRAFDAFLRFVGTHLDGDMRRVAEHGFVAISEEAGRLSSSSYYVRQMVGVDPENGVIALAEPVVEGQRVSFTLREPQDAWRQLQGDLGTIARQRGGRKPAFGLFFNCAGRTSQFFGMPGVDTALIKAAFGEFPLIGFYGGAEFAPLVGRNRVNFFSGILLLVDDPA